MTCMQRHWPAVRLLGDWPSIRVSQPAHYLPALAVEREPNLEAHDVCSSVQAEPVSLDGSGPKSRIPLIVPRV